jgi:hypothetical protein
MTTHITRICSVLIVLLLTLTLLPACSGDDDLPTGPASRVKVKLLNKDCMGTVLAILDVRYFGWGQAGYSINNENYTGAVWVQQGDQLFAGLTVGEEYSVDMESVETGTPGVCKRAPGPPDKAVVVYKVY